jgi:hypothetical protein
MWEKNSTIKTGVIYNNPPLSIVHNSRNGSPLALNLPALIERMKRSDAWTNGELNAEGKLMFHSRKESLALDKEHLMTLHENVDYSLTTEEETVFLSTITSGLNATSYNN